jgi:hypothetical protein
MTAVGTGGVPPGYTVLLRGDGRFDAVDPSGAVVAAAVADPARASAAARVHAAGGSAAAVDDAAFADELRLPVEVGAATLGTLAGDLADAVATLGTGAVPAAVVSDGRDGRGELIFADPAGAPGPGGDPADQADDGVPGKPARDGTGPDRGEAP